MRTFMSDRLLKWFGHIALPLLAYSGFIGKDGGAMVLLQIYAVLAAALGGVLAHSFWRLTQEAYHSEVAPSSLTVAYPEPDWIGVMGASVAGLIATTLCVMNGGYVLGALIGFWTLSYSVAEGAAPGVVAMYNRRVGLARA